MSSQQEGDLDRIVAEIATVLKEIDIALVDPKSHEIQDLLRRGEELSGRARALINSTETAS